MSLKKYHLGCPMWANKAWIGEIFPRNVKATALLSHYASIFNAVEGNTTFYGLPKPTTVQRWHDETGDDFRFCFKFPRSISHEQRLIDTQTGVQAFFELFAPLGKKLGPFFLQLPPTFGMEEMDALETFLSALPRDFNYAVEVRHKDFSDNADAELMLHELLANLDIDRVIFDTSGLQSLRTRVPALLDAQKRKPKLPPRYIATGPHPFVRFIGDPHIENSEGDLQVWARVVAQWISEGRRPYFFAHHPPDDAFGPRVARIFHNLLTGYNLQTGDLPDWPINNDLAQDAQMSLF